jgi:tetratricopeptide (TPR) repeat protein
MLLNRLRRHPLYRVTPILIFSSRLTEADFRLLEELPCTRLLDCDKATRHEVAAAVDSLLEEGVWYRENSGMIENVVDFIEADGAQALQLLRGPLRNAPNPVPLGVLMGRTLREHGFVAEAAELLQAILARNAQSVPVLTELGKVMHLQGYEKEAFKLLERATALSPSNLQRLCLLGEVSLAMGEPEAAQRHLGAALGIDPNDSVASAGMELAKNATFPTAPSADGVARMLASTLNLRGVTLARQGRHTEAIEQYQGAIRVVLRSIDRARVAFNIGLCYMRWQKVAEARQWFAEADRFGAGAFAKPGQYLAKLPTDQAKAAAEQQLAGGPIIFDDDEEKLFG